MVAFSPSQARSYSESPPPVKAISACDSGSCDSHLHQQLIQDVFYVMGRRIVNNIEKPQYTFYKIQSIGTFQIDKFAAAMPDVPWVFLYRDTIEVMQSHLGKVKSTGMFGTQKPVCARNYGTKNQPTTTIQAIRKAGRKIKDLSMIEYCAAHLAGLSLSALNEHERAHRGRLINYNHLPDIVWNDVFPHHFKVPIGDSGIARMKEASLFYSKGRGNLANKEFEDDTKKKQESAPPSVIRAANIFVKDIYEKMEILSNG
jgi:hypothetical protein